MNQPSQKLDDQIAVYLSGRATAEETSALEKRLAGDPEARTLFLAHARMDAAFSGESQSALEAPPEQKPIAFPSLKRHRTWLAAAAAIALIATVAAFLVSKNYNDRAGLPVEILASSGLAAESFPSGKTIRLDEARVVQGTAKMRLNSGVILDLHGPAEMRFVDSMRAILKSGNVTVDVADASASGFVVESPTLRIVDHGTRFGVSYRENGETDVAVLDGKVSVFKQTDDGDDTPLADLSEGDAVRIDSLYVTRRLAAVSLDGLSLAILDGNGKNVSVVSDVTDSIREADFRRFYSIAPAAMGPGARPYSTLGKPRWQAMRGEGFPDELVGADVIATFSLDRFDAKLSLTLSLAKPATVYLMADKRAVVPDWLERDFEKTTLQLRAGPWGERWAGRVVDGFMIYDVWKREVTEGEVVLGSPYVGASTRETAMYGLAVKAKREN